ncbi:MAG: hypothetical protein ACLP9L_11615 [Thermoguttaceae bacterium]
MNVRIVSHSLVACAALFVSSAYGGIVYVSTTGFNGDLPTDPGSNWTPLKTPLALNQRNSTWYFATMDQATTGNYSKSVSYVFTGSNLGNGYVTVANLNYTGQAANGDGFNSVTPVAGVPLVPGSLKQSSTGLQFDTTYSTNNLTWEMVGLQTKATSLRPSLTSVSVNWLCYCSANKTTLGKGSAHAVSNAKLDAGDPGPMITTFWEFPETASIDTTAIPTFTADPSTGVWTYQYVYEAPDGSARPFGGVEWTTTGSGIPAGAEFGWSDSMTGPNATLYDDFFHDSTTGDTIEITTECTPEPSTVIIWSLLGGIGLGLGYWRRKRAA